MTNSLKIEGGEKLGRTIIFAVNQEHSKFIVDCFLKRYPEQPVDFIADQMNFIQTIIEHLTKNGMMELSKLFEPLFTDMNDQGLMGIFDDGNSQKIISIVEHTMRMHRWDSSLYLFNKHF